MISSTSIIVSVAAALAGITLRVMSHFQNESKVSKNTLVKYGFAIIACETIVICFFLFVAFPLAEKINDLEKTGLAILMLSIYLLRIRRWYRKIAMLSA